jgi:hypothetical protein
MRELHLSVTLRFDVAWFSDPWLDSLSAALVRFGTDEPWLVSGDDFSQKIERADFSPRMTATSQNLAKEKSTQDTKVE